ncbi:MAG: N-acetyltransferase [Neisseriaceae bacterium]|nr:MAG: N-acetyltransferase [Neisseriaceae bacterium]
MVRQSHKWNKCVHKERKISMIAQTERLTIRKIILEDAEFIFELMNQPSWIRFIGDRGLRSLEATIDYLRDGILKTYANSDIGLFVIVRKSDGEPLGITSLIKRTDLPQIDLGFALLERYAGRGYAYEASLVTLTYCHSHLKLDNVLAISQPNNLRSAQLLQKLNFSKEKLVNLSHTNNELQLWTYHQTKSIGTR